MHAKGYKTMSKIKYAIFDVGQVIYPFSLKPLTSLMQQKTTNPDIFANHTPAHYDYKPYMKGKLTNEEFAQELCFFCQVPYTPDMLTKINEALHLGCGPRFTQTQNAIQKLRSNNIEICLLSNALPILADTGLDIAKPEYCFTSYNLGLLKPDTNIFSTIQQKLDVPFNQILFIDDKEENVKSAQSLGINSIVFNKKTILKDINPYIPNSLQLTSKTDFSK